MVPHQPHLTSEETAETLDISVRQLNNLVRSNVLNAIYPEGKGYRSQRLFKHEDVMAYLEIKDKKLSLVEIAVMSRQAYVTSRATERQLEQVISYLGLDLPRLSHRRADVMRLYVKVEDVLEDEDRDLKPENLLEWARIFYAIGEEYLWLIEEVVEDHEPWRKLLDLANTLYKNAPREEYNQDKRIASIYGFLSSGRRNLCNVSYFYIRNNHGPRAAAMMFPSSQGDRTERIINVAFPDQQ